MMCVRSDVTSQTTISFPLAFRTCQKSPTSSVWPSAALNWDMKWSIAPTGKMPHVIRVRTYIVDAEAAKLADQAFPVKCKGVLNGLVTIGPR